MGVAVVVLSAGRSSRFGGTKSKVLTKFDGKPLIAKIAQQALSSRCSKVLIVTGHQSLDVEAALIDMDVDTLHNPRFEQGMGTSIAVAAQHLARDDNSVTAMMLLFGDMPMIRTEHLNTLLNHPDAGSKIIRGANGDRAGHPILFPSESLPKLQMLSGDEGAKELVQGASLIDIGSAATFDIDTREAALQAGASLDFF